MHELSICIALLDQVQKIADENGARRVAKITVKIGPLSGVEAGLLLNAFPLAAAGTLAVDADLIIEHEDVVVHCPRCGVDSSTETNRLLCSRCGDFRTQLVSGDAMVLQRVEMDKAEKVALRRKNRFEATTR